MEQRLTAYSPIVTGPKLNPIACSTQEHPEGRIAPGVRNNAPLLKPVHPWSRRGRVVLPGRQEPWLRPSPEGFATRW